MPCGAARRCRIRCEWTLTHTARSWLLSMWVTLGRRVSWWETLFLKISEVCRMNTRKLDSLVGRRCELCFSASRRRRPITSVCRRYSAVHGVDVLLIRSVMAGVPSSSLYHGPLSLSITSNKWVHGSVSLLRSLQVTWRHLTMLSKVWRPTKHIIGHVGDGFYGSKDPTNSVKALKEERS